MHPQNTQTFCELPNTRVSSNSVRMSIDNIWYYPLVIEFKKGTWTDDAIIHFIMMILHCTFYNFVFQVTLWIQVFLRMLFFTILFQIRIAVFLKKRWKSAAFLFWHFDAVLVFIVHPFLSSLNSIIPTILFQLATTYN